jgi:hypothetical protein
LNCQRRDLKSGQRGSSSPVQTPGGIIPFRWATSFRYDGRHHSVTVGAIISLWWAASPGISRMPPPMRLSRDLLIRGIIYKLQERAYGGLSRRFTPGKSI